MMSRTALVAINVLLGATAYAQPAPQTADTLFKQGRTLLSLGEYQEACASFAESLKLDEALGTRLNLGLCYEQWGRLQSAYAEFEKAKGVASSSNQPDLEKAALDHMAKLEPRIPRLNVSVSPSPVPPNTTITITRQGHGPQTVAANSPIPLDPSGKTGLGSVTIEVNAPGYQPWISREPIELIDGIQPATFDVTMVQLGIADRSSGEQHTPGIRKKLGLGLAIGGGAALITSLVLAIRWHQEADGCGGVPSCISPYDNDLTRYGNSIFGLGLTLTVIGAYAFFTAPSVDGKARTTFVPNVGADHAGLVWVGSF
jgi:tetratricopeptide (TPR) repeat protein